MRKIKLQLDSLAVESFDTTRAQPAEGTVEAHQEWITRDTCLRSCAESCWRTCGTCYDTCVQTCPNTCWASCYGTCGGDSCVLTCVYTCGYCGPRTADTCFLRCVP